MVVWLGPAGGSTVVVCLDITRRSAGELEVEAVSWWPFSAQPPLLYHHHSQHLFRRCSPNSVSSSYFHTTPVHHNLLNTKSVLLVK